MQQCLDCTQHAVLRPHHVAALKARDYGLRAVSELAHDEVGARKPLEPSGWFSRVLDSVLAEGVLDPILITHGPDGLELIDGHHRAWAAAHHGLDAPAVIFTPTCGECSEESVAAAAMSRTAGLGWMYEGPPPDSR